MRTTVDIADDVLFAARELARRERKTIGQVASELMRRALSSPADAGNGAAEPTGDEIDRRFQALGFRTLPARGGIVTNERIDQLREREGV